jgi:hypothetical protein
MQREDRQMPKIRFDNLRQPINHYAMHLKNMREIIAQLETNERVISSLLLPQPVEVYTWKPAPEKWCLLEIICHLYDEEREDFRARLKHVLETPNEPLPPIDPVGWVTERKYLERDFAEMIHLWQKERQISLQWLKSLDQPPLGQAYLHPKFGAMSGWMFLSSWLAHDYLHIRQIARTLYLRLEATSEVPLSYAGGW